MNLEHADWLAEEDGDDEVENGELYDGDQDNHGDEDDYES